jgi:hypothetical protein
MVKGNRNFSTCALAISAFQQEKAEKNNQRFFTLYLSSFFPLQSRSDKVAFTFKLT